MSYFNEINGYLSSLKESQANEATMSADNASKKAQSITEKFQSINSTIESAGGIMVAGAEGWFKGRKILEKLGKAVKGKKPAGSGGAGGGGDGNGVGSGTDITSTQTPNGAGTVTRDAALGDVKSSVGDGDLAPSGLSRTINPSTDGKINVSKGKGPADRKPPTQEPEADNPLGGGQPLKETQGVDNDLRSQIQGLFKKPAQAGRLGDAPPMAASDAQKAAAASRKAASSKPSSLADTAGQDSGKNISSLADDVSAQARAGADDLLSNIKSSTTKFGFNLGKPSGSTAGGGGGGGGAAGDSPATNLTDTLSDLKAGSNNISSQVDGIGDSLVNGLKSQGKKMLSGVADNLGVDTDAVMGSANLALDGVPIVGEIFGIGTMIAGLVKDIAGKGGDERKAEEAQESAPESARGAVDTTQVASSGGTTQGSYIA
tara:strand:- start:8301 stop:9593 length:1293 start_codon:yes stop_codon:yes gene_type:complete